MPWQKIKTKAAPLRRVPYKYYFVAGILLVMAVYLVTFREKTIAYNYGGETCDNRLLLLPDVFGESGSDNYEVTSRGGWSLGGYRLTATALCITPAEPPEENTVETIAYAPWGGWFARLSYHIETNDHPAVDASVLGAPIPVSRTLHLPLSEPDETFSYHIVVGEGKAECISEKSQLSCDIPMLELEQGSEYALALERRFKDEKVDEVMQATIETLSPLSVVASSIARDATVYDKPKSVTLAVDKPLGKTDFTAWRVDGETPTELTVTAESQGQEAIITFAEDLPRQATIELRATAFEASDGSTTLDPYVLPFKTSGGPKVTGVNVGSTGVDIGSQIVVTFDQELSTDQDLSALVATGGGVTYQARQGNQLFFSTGGTGRCQDISITLKPDIKSPYDIFGQSAWQYNGRTICYTVTTIGYSVKGRAIQAYHFGNGGSSIVYTGAIHGSEYSTKSLMDRWIQELDANPGQIPAGKRVIVVPSINPDGLAAGSRVNARNVDLNRNFAVSDWQKDIQHTNGSAFPGGGGETPMSEPETKAIAGFIAQQRPELVVSYHSIGSLVIPSQGGQSNARASQYASLSGYKLSPGGGGEFGYQITGTADDYYREKLGVPSVLVELGSHSYHQFERNRSAMWAMMQ